uniref:Actin-like ATPase domain-containing protein n=1 Tax=Panagrolaimus sp. JU765 TaxID=591449 RepID=A0AC34RSZ8_9BILA
MAYGRDTGLIINVGYNETTVYPVVNNLILLKCYESGYGARHFHEEVENYLKERGKIRDENGEIKKLDETDMKNFIEDGLVEDLALISMATRKDRGLLLRNWDYEHAEEHFQFAPDVEIQLRSKTLIVSGFLREALAECFFISEKESDSPSIQELIYRSLKNCPVDYRKQLANSLIITGGTRRMKGFVGRLRRELRDLFATQDGGLMKHLCDEIKFPTTPQDVGIEKYDAWLGATLYADSEDYPIYDKTAYQDGEKIPDWTSMIDNYKVPISMDKIVHEEERKLLINFNELKAQ